MYIGFQLMRGKVIITRLSNQYRVLKKIKIKRSEKKTSYHAVLSTLTGDRQEERALPSTEMLPQISKGQEEYNERKCVLRSPMSGMSQYLKTQIITRF